MPEKQDLGRKAPKSTCPKHRWERAAAALWTLGFQVEQTRVPVEFACKLPTQQFPPFFIYLPERPIGLLAYLMTVDLLQDLSTLFIVFIMTSITVGLFTAEKIKPCKRIYVSQFSFLHVYIKCLDIRCLILHAIHLICRIYKTHQTPLK